MKENYARWQEDTEYCTSETMLLSHCQKMRHSLYLLHRTASFHAAVTEKYSEFGMFPLSWIIERNFSSKICNSRSLDSEEFCLMGWDVMLCHYLLGDGGTMFIQNVITHLPDNMASLP